MGYAFFIVSLAAALMMLLFNSAAAQGAAEGLKLFARSMLPCIFPFMVCGQFFLALSERRSAGLKAARRSERRKASGLLLRLSSAFGAVLEAVLCCVCGIPSAAMLLRRRAENGLSPNRASALCALMNRASPMFIAGFAATELLNRPRLWPALMAAHYAPALLAAFVMGFTRAYDSDVRASGLGSLTSPPPAESQLALLGGAISSASAAALRICGTVVFFRVIVSVLSETGLSRALGPAPFAIASGMLEMTGGLSLAALLPADTRLCASILSFLMSFGGICVYMQSSMFFEKLRPLPYFIAKLADGAASFALCVLLCPNESPAAPVFAPGSQVLGTSAESIYSRGVTLLYAGLSFALAGAASYLYSRLFIRRRAIP